MIRVLACAAAALGLMAAAVAYGAEGGWKPGLAYDHVLPNVPGKSLRAVVVE